MPTWCYGNNHNSVVNQDFSKRFSMAYFWNPGRQEYLKNLMFARKCQLKGTFSHEPPPIMFYTYTRITCHSGLDQPINQQPLQKHTSRAFLCICRFGDWNFSYTAPLATKTFRLLPPWRVILKRFFEPCWCMINCDKQRLQTSTSLSKNLWKILAGHTGDWFDVKTASICTTELWDALKSFILSSLKFKVAPYPIIVSLDTLTIWPSL